MAVGRIVKKKEEREKMVTGHFQQTRCAGGGWILERGIIFLAVFAMAAACFAADRPKETSDKFKELSRAYEVEGSGSEEFKRILRTSLPFFQRLKTRSEPGKMLWHECIVNDKGQSFDAIRFKTAPSKEKYDLFWCIVPQENSSFRSWSMFPAKGPTKDYLGRSGLLLRTDLKVNTVDLPKSNKATFYLSAGCRLEPDTEYVIWFTFETNEPEKIYVALNLIKTSVDTEAYRNLFEWLREAAELEDTAAQICLGHMYASGSDLVRDYPEARKWYETLIKEADSSDALRKNGRYYSVRGEYRRAQTLYERALNEALTTGAPDSEIAACEGDLAYMYMKLGKLAEAETMCLSTLERQEKVYSENHPYVAYTLRNLSNVYGSFHHDLIPVWLVQSRICQAKGDMGKAKILLTMSLGVAKNKTDSGHLVKGDVLSQLGEFYISSKEYDKAEEVLQEAVKVLENSYGTNNDHTAIALNNLAKVYINQGKYSKAQSLCHRALDTLGKIFDERHPNVIDVMETLSQLRRKTGSMAETANLEWRVKDTARTEKRSAGKKGTLVIFSTPTGADMRVNGTMIGTTSKRIELRFPVEAGQVKVRIEKEGYMPWEREISVGEGSIVPIEVELKKKGD